MGAYHYGAVTRTASFLAGLAVAGAALWTGINHNLILALFVWIIIQQEVMMATKDEILGKIGELGAALGNVRSDIQALKDQLAAGGLTAEEEAEVVAALDEKLAEAKALAEEN
jgi:predicted trehalose synthase